MTRSRRRPRVWQVLALGLGAALALVVLTLPPRPRDLTGAPPVVGSRPFPVTLAGAYHIHTTRSDGSGTVEQVAAAAAGLGLHFVILTDHGDGTRPPDPPRYAEGVLVIDGVEISTDDGHYVALGLPASPYPLAGAARDVAEDVRRLGGFGVAAHPDSPKRDLAWTDWDVPIDGLEWLNADTAWRDESWASTARLVARYPFRPPAALMTMLSYPAPLMARWDALAARRPVVALPAADAHARLWGRLEVRDIALPITVRAPSYESSFRTFALHVQLERPLDGSGSEDGARVIEAIRRGRLFSAITALATPPRFAVEAIRHGEPFAVMGDEIPAGAPFEIAARVVAPEGTRVRLFENGRLVSEQPAPELRHAAPGRAAVYRAEVWLPPRRGEADVPWIVGSPIFVRSPRPAAAPALDRPDGEPAALVVSAPDIPWTVEHDPASTAVARRPTGETIALDYALAPGRRASQYAALVTGAVRGQEPWRRLRFRARAERPMRLSVQVREPATAHRWVRSVYLDESEREIVVSVDELRPVAGASAVVPLAELHALLFVVDTVNTPPGARGTVWLDAVRIE